MCPECDRQMETENRSQPKHLPATVCLHLQTRGLLVFLVDNIAIENKRDCWDLG